LRISNKTAVISAMLLMVMVGEKNTRAGFAPIVILRSFLSARQVFRRARYA
jgi:hypothetical protein